MTATREIKEGLQYQGVEEGIVYTLTTTPWGSSPSNPAVAVFAIATDGTKTDVTTTVMPSGSPSVAGDVITLPKLRSLVKSVLYRVEVLFTCSGNDFEAFGFVLGEE